MEGLKYCEIKIPVKGTKLKMIGNRIIFARTLKGIVYYYDQRTRVLLCCVCEERTDYAEALIERRINEVDMWHNSTKTSNMARASEHETLLDLI